MLSRVYVPRGTVGESVELFSLKRAEAFGRAPTRKLPRKDATESDETEFSEHQAPSLLLFFFIKAPKDTTPVTSHSGILAASPIYRYVGALQKRGEDPRVL
ncbi:hypothetical protein MTO96_000894 [Rhipicephalus appendiculatus]